MRWDGQRLTAATPGALPGLESVGAARVVRTPEFAGITFHEVLARSALNRQVAESRISVDWTINPYRGCTHACVYCFARPTHTFLDLDAGDDFDRQIVVKTNVAEVLRRELARPSWARDHVALGTNTDPYQRAEGRYRLMPGIIGALADSGTPFSILTKGPLLARDLPLLASAAERVPIGLSVSIAVLDPALHASLEPGTPSPAARLRLVRAIRDAGFACTVLVAPILPFLTDSAAALRALVEAVASAGATSVVGLPLRLSPGTREWFAAWVRRERPDLVAGYRDLYGDGAHPRPPYADRVAARLEAALAGVRLETATPGPVVRGRVAAAPVAETLDDTLF